MSFHQSCQLIRVEVRDDGTWLLAAARAGDNSVLPAELRLDDHIGNSDGYFTWDGSNFTRSAANIDLSFREDGVWLEADLNGGQGERQEINLSHRIENQDGDLVVV